MTCGLTVASSPGLYCFRACRLQLQLLPQVYLLPSLVDFFIALSFLRTTSLPLHNKSQLLNLNLNLTEQSVGVPQERVVSL